MRRVLMISYYFPPLGGIGSVRALKFARYLPDFGWDPTVIAPRDGFYYRDPTLEFDEAKVIRTASLEISRAAKRTIGSGRDDTRATRVGPALRHIQSFVRRWIYRPDPQIGWYPYALYSAQQALRAKHFDAVFSSSFPITAHLVARRLHRTFDLPWLAEFRDLWTDLTQYDSTRREHLDKTTEKAVLRTATEVVTVSDGYAKLFSQRGARRVSVVTNGFDPADFQGKAKSTRTVVTYVGAYYPDRQDLRAALLALGGLVRSGSLSDLVLRFVGEFPETLRDTLRIAGLVDAAECTGFVSHGEALRHLEDSSLLLIAGPVSTVFPSSKLRGNIASKVFEYLGSRRSILYVGDLDSEVAEVLVKFDGVACVASGDITAAKGAIVRLIQRPTSIERRELEGYTRRALAGQLAQILDNAAQKTERCIANRDTKVP